MLNDSHKTTHILTHVRLNLKITMRLKLTFILILLIGKTMNSQISVQVVGYWGMNEKYEYKGSYQKYKVTGKDTVFESDMTYDITIKITDSTSNSYKVEWLYKNHKFKRGNKIAKLISNPTDSVKVEFITDELGAFKEVLNMEELLSFYDKKFKTLIKESRDKELKKILIQVNKQFKNENFIKNNSYKDLLNFYTFHGAKYDLKKEYNAKMKTSNNYGGEPFDTEVKVWLDEIDSENNNFIMRSYQKIDSIQLKNAVSKHLKAPLNKIPEITNETYIANRIHGTGWTTYSILTREVNSDNSKSVEEYIIKIK